MGFVGKLSELLRRPRDSREGFPWTFYRLISPSLTVAEIVLALAIITSMMARGGTINQGAATAITALIENWDRFRLLPNPAEALAIVLLIHKGGDGLMSVIEKVIQPLLVAQRQLGRSEGLTEGRTEGFTEGRSEERTQWRDWLDRKARADAEGKPFDEPPPDEKKLQPAMWSN